MGAEDLSRRIGEFLRRRGAPASSLLLAGEFLKIAAPGEDVATALLKPTLHDQGLDYLEGVGWWFAGGKPLGRHFPADASPSGQACRAAPGPAGISEEAPSRVVACAVASSPSRIAGRRRPSGSPAPRAGIPSSPTARPEGITGVCLIEVATGAAGEPHPPGSSQRLDHLRWRAISGLLDGAEAIFTNPRVEAPPLLAGLARRGLPGPARVRSLATAVRGTVRIPRGSTTEAIAAALGCGHREGDTPGDAAVEIAACLRAAGEILARRRTGRSEEPRSPFTGGAPFTPEFLEAVPASPGVYRFFGADGRLLYVGKAADLRRRLRAYARTAARGRSDLERVVRGAARRVKGRPAAKAAGGGGADAAARVHRVEYEVLGSDLEALLKEARLIASRSPRANVQRAIRERGRAYAAGRTQALILPARGEGAASVVFVREGRLEGWCRFGPRGGGDAEASRILRRILAPRRRAAAEGRAAGRDSRGAPDPRTEILNSWLARHGEGVSRVDLDACLGAADGLSRLRRAVAEFVSSPGEVFLRR